MAIRAIPDKFLLQRRKLSARFDAMTLEATLREGGGVTLRLMDVVASRTAHVRRRFVAPAHLQKSDLISVNVGCRRWTGTIRAVVFVERFSWNVRKWICEWWPQTAMALCAKIDLPIAAQSCRIDDCRVRFFRGHRFDMQTAGTVASLAGNPKFQTLPFELIGKDRRANRSRVIQMAPEAVWKNALLEIGFAVLIIWTVDPSGQTRPIRNWKLK